MGKHKIDSTTWRLAYWLMTETSQETEQNLLAQTGSMAIVMASSSEAWANLDILEEIARGGMGIVYKAQHRAMQRFCAVKVLNQRSDAPAIQRFVKEAKLVCSFDHPNIVKVFSVGFTPEEKPFISMEYLEGRSLDAAISEWKTLHPREFASVFSQVLNAIEYAHERGVIHRDLKPANIFLVNATEDEPSPVKLLDFGIARIMETEASEVKLTQTGTLLGTPMYMSPEQSRHESLDQRSDIYSIGVVMFEALTGEPPFNGDSALEVLYKQANELADPAKLPVDQSYHRLNQCILKCLRKKPEERFQNITELKTELLESCSSLDERPKETKKNRMLLPLVIAGFCVVAIWGLQLFQNQARESQRSDRTKLTNTSMPTNTNPKQLLISEQSLRNKINELKRNKKEGQAEQKLREACNICDKVVEICTAQIEESRSHSHQPLHINRSDRTQVESAMVDAPNYIVQAETDKAGFLLLQNKIDKALEAYSRATKAAPYNYAFRSRSERSAALVLISQHRSNEAYAKLEALIKLDDHPADPNFDYCWERSCNQLTFARLLLQRNQTKEAEKYFRYAIDPNMLSPRHPGRLGEGLLGLASCDQDPKTKTAKYLEAYKALLVADDDMHDTDNIALACTECGKYFEKVDKKQARECYEKAIEIGKRGISPSTLADVLRQATGFENDNGNFDGVENLIESAKASKISTNLQSANRAGLSDGFPIDSESDFARGVSAFLQNDPRHAVGEFHNALDKAESSRLMEQRVLWMVGRCYFKAQRGDEAYGNFKKALKISPEHEFMFERKFYKGGLPEHIALLHEKGNSIEEAKWTEEMKSARTP